MPRSSSRRGRGRGRGRGRSSSRGGGRGWGRGRGTRRYFASLEWQQEQDRKNGVVRVVKGPDGQFHPLSWRQGDTLELGDEHGTVAQVLHNRQVCDKIRTVTSEKVGYKNASFRRALRDGLEVLAKLRHVETMHLKDCHAATVAGLEGCTTLRELHFEDSGMTDLGQLGEKLIALETLQLDSCAHVVHLTALGRSKSLRTLKLAWCSSLVSIAGLAECTSLETLMIKFCHQIHDYDTLRNCVSLRSLEIEGSELVDTVGFGCIPNLETLTLTGIFNKDMGDHLCASTTLRALDVTFLGSTLSFDGLDCIPTLQTLRLHGTEVTSWSFLANCVALQEVWLRGFSVPPSDLESACRSLQQLRSIRVEGRKNCWPSLESVCRAVAQAKSLTMLSLSHTSCKGGLDNSLSQLATLPNLQTIDLNGTRSFRDAFDQLAQITSLTKVDVSFTQAGENIVDVLAKLPALQEAVLTGCPKAHGKVSLLKHVPLVLAGKASTCLGEKRTVKDDETKLREESRGRGRGRGGARGRGRGW